MARPTVDVKGAGYYDLSITPNGGEDLGLASGFTNTTTPPAWDWGGAAMVGIVDSDFPATGNATTLSRISTVGTGSKTILESDGDFRGGMVACTLSGVDTGSIVASSGSTNGTGSSISQAVTCGADQIIIAYLAVSAGGADGAATGTVNTTVEVQDADFNRGILVSSTTDINVTLGGSDPWSLVWAVINGVGGGGGGIPADRGIPKGLIRSLSRGLS